MVLLEKTQGNGGHWTQVLIMLAYLVMEYSESSSPKIVICDRNIKRVDKSRLVSDSCYFEFSCSTVVVFSSGHEFR